MSKRKLAGPISMSRLARSRRSERIAAERAARLARLVAQVWRDEPKKEPK